MRPWPYLDEHPELLVALARIAMDIGADGEDVVEAAHDVADALDEGGKLSVETLLHVMNNICAQGKAA